MSKMQIPESWASSELHDLCEFIRNGYSLKQNKAGKGSPVSRIETIAAGEIDFSRIGFGDIAKDRKEQYRLQNGDILFSHINSLEHIGKTALFQSERELYHGMNLLCMRPKSLILPKFLTYFLKSGSTREYFKSKCKRAINQVSINTKEVGALGVPVPPISEQNRIVVKIESTQEKVKTIESSISKAEELIEKYRESLLQKAFRGELVPQDPKDEPASNLIERIRNERAEQSQGKKKKKDDLPPIKPEEIPFEIPKSWQWVRIGVLFQLGILEEHKDGNHGSNYPRSNEFVSEGVPFLTAKSIDASGQLDGGLFEYLSRKKAQSLTIGHIKKGDVLFAHNATVGPVVEYNFDFEDALIGTSLTCFRPNTEYLNQTFLSYALQSWVFQSQVNRVMGQATRNQVPITKQREMILPLPPLSEQLLIAKKIQELLPSTLAAAQKIRHIGLVSTALSNSILNSAFSGRLVGQDVSEGTGQELLQALTSDKQTADDTKNTNTKKRKKK